MKKIASLFIAASLLISCNEDDNSTTTEPVVYTSGTADFSKFVSVGNSLTAGFSDGALFIEGQQNSLPNILATQFALAGGGEFKLPLPLMNDNLGGMLYGGTQVRPNRLILDLTGEDGPAPVPVSGVPTTEITTSIAPQGPYNNMGVPGAKSYHLEVPGYATLNPYYGRMATSAGATVLDDALDQNASFFSLWIGNNDVLSYAMSGGSGVDQTGNPNPATYAGNDITDPMAFAGIYDGLAQALSNNGTKPGVVANIPSVTDSPYFTTVPYNPVPLDEATANQLNMGFASYNGGLDYVLSLGIVPTLTADEVAKRKVVYAAGENNAVLIADEDLTDLTGFGLPSMRQATADDLILLLSGGVSAQAFIGSSAGAPTAINGVSVPLADNWVLTPEEQTAISDATNSYNTAIEAAATTYGLAFVNAKSLLSQLATTGITQNGITSNSTYATGGAFSLDGVHPSPRGAAIAANAFIDAINEKYGSNLPYANVADYKPLYLF